ncbi:unnamed protein product [Gordionus sp. m RMFG-2023]|uniref:DNA replication complex GINS protein PSF2-like n=1 Tax=Gordionus sp. m RMFG-2023 TaxID=3053472 RepID=UPI0030E2A2C8
MISFDPINIEFIAENEFIYINPNFQSPPFKLISCDIGEMTPGIPTSLPLWVAIHLKQRRKCSIIPPKWMDIDTLEELKMLEKENQYFTAMPSPHYMEIANLLMQEASEDIVDCCKVKLLLKDLWDLRISKLKSSIQTLTQNASNINHVQINHLTMMEINTVRGILSSGLDILNDLTKHKRNAHNSSSLLQSSYDQYIFIFSIIGRHMKFLFTNFLYL